MKISHKKEDNIKWFDFPYAEGIKLKLEFCLKPDLSWEDVLGLIHDWEGFEGENGEPFPCTNANKVNLAYSEDGKAILLWAQINISSMNGFIDADSIKKKLNITFNGNGATQKQVEKTA